MIARSYSRKRVGLLFGTVIARSELHGEANYGTALLLFLWRKMSKVVSRRPFAVLARCRFLGKMAVRTRKRHVVEKAFFVNW